MFTGNESSFGRIEASLDRRMRMIRKMQYLRADIGVRESKGR